MRTRVLALAVMVHVMGCDAGRPATVSPAPGSANGSSTRPPGPRVEVRNGATPGSVEIVAHEAVSLDAKLLVERATDTGTFELTPLDLDSMKLVESCSDKIGPCVSLDAGRILKPVPWSGMSCSSQCNGNCDKNIPREGRHRFVVVTCDGKQRFEGPVFEMRDVTP